MCSFLSNSSYRNNKQGIDRCLSPITVDTATLSLWTTESHLWKMVRHFGHCRQLRSKGYSTSAEWHNSHLNPLLEHTCMKNQFILHEGKEKKTLKWQGQIPSTKLEISTQQRTRICTAYGNINHILLFWLTHRTLSPDVHGVLSVNGGEVRQELTAVHLLQVHQGEPPCPIPEVWESIKSPEQLDLLGHRALQKVHLHHQQILPQSLQLEKKLNLMIPESYSKWCTPTSIVINSWT